MTSPTEKKPNPPANGRRNTIIWGLVVLAFAAYLLAFLLPDFIRTVAGPQEVTLTEAAEIAAADDTYVAISDGEWACETIKYVRGPSGSDVRRIDTRFTEVFMTSETGGVVLLAQLSGEVDCEELANVQLSGYLNRMTADQEQELINEVRLARFVNASVFLEMCGYCGPSNSLIGTLFGFVFAAVGIGLLFYGFTIKGGNNR